MQQYLEPDLDKIDIADQARKHFDDADLLSLGENIRELGLLMPLLVIANGGRFTLVAGERRLRAMRLVGLKKAQVMVLNAMDAGDTAVVQFIENEFRSDLNPTEKANAMFDIKQKKGWTNKELGERLHMDQSSPTRYLSLFDTIPAVQEAAAAGKIGPNAWYSISHLPAEEQPGLLAKHLAGMPASQIAELSRKKRNGTAQAVKVAKVKCLLPSGVQIVVSGKGVSLDEAIEALVEAAREMKKAKEQGISARTFAAAMKDKSRKG